MSGLEPRHTPSRTMYASERNASRFSVGQLISCTQVHRNSNRKHCNCKLLCQEAAAVLALLLLLCVRVYRLFIDINIMILHVSKLPDHFPFCDVCIGEPAVTVDARGADRYATRQHHSLAHTRNNSNYTMQQRCYATTRRNNSNAVVECMCGSVAGGCAVCDSGAGQICSPFIASLATRAAQRAAALRTRGGVLL